MNCKLWRKWWIILMIDTGENIISYNILTKRLKIIK